MNASAGGAMSAVEWVLFVAAGLVAVAALLWMALLRRRKFTSICACCRYPTRGLPGWSCPECGSDLRQVGIMSARLRHRAHAGVAMTLWLVAMTVMGVGLRDILNWYVFPYKVVVGGGASIQGPDSNAFPRMDASKRWRGVFWPSDYRAIHWYESTFPQRVTTECEITLTLTCHDGSTSELSINVIDPSYRRVDRDGRPVAGEGRVTGQVLADWCGEAGIDSSRATVRAELDDVARWFEENYSDEVMPVDLKFYSSFFGILSSGSPFSPFSVSQDRLLWPQLLAAGVYLVPVILGARWIVRFRPKADRRDVPVPEPVAE